MVNPISLVGISMIVAAHTTRSFRIILFGLAGFAISLPLFAPGLQAQQTSNNKPRFSVVVHGGAGVEPDKLTEQQRKRHHDSLAKALEVAREGLTKGDTALDVVERTIRVLEDDPLYNAGRGAVFNSEGKHELDASIMDGSNLKSGAVAGVTTIKNPISLARLVMSQTRHILLMGAGAERFADEMRDQPQIERVDNSYFSTDEQRDEWKQAVEREKQSAKSKAHMGTVGCVVLDSHGHLAAGTSTGGLTNKRWGRVGDSPIVGAGTYADDSTCAVSCTGTGEYFIRHSAAFHVSALMKYRKASLDEAVAEVIDHVLPDDTGGMIAVDHQGHITTRFNTPGMARGWIDSRGALTIQLGK